MEEEAREEEDLNTSQKQNEIYESSKIKPKEYTIHTQSTKTL